MKWNNGSNEVIKEYLVPMKIVVCARNCLANHFFFALHGVLFHRQKAWTVKLQ